MEFVAGEREGARLRLGRLLVVAVFSLAFSLLLNLVVAGFFVDDAYISFHYADNLVQEGSLYYNKGQEGPIGYTNPLYVFLLAGLRWASAGTLSYEVISRGLGSLSLGAILFAVLSSITSHQGRVFSPACAGLALLLFLFFPYMLPNFYSGMETGPFTLCLFAMLLSVDARTSRREICFLAALATALSLRIDGFAVVLPLLGSYVLAALRQSETARVLRLGWAFLAAGLVYCLQLLLTGFWVPLSFYQKSSPFSVRTLWSYLAFFLLVLTPFAVITYRRTQRQLTALAVFYSLLVSLFYSFFMHWMFKRYVFPVAFALFAAFLLAFFKLDLRRHGREVALALTFFLFTFPDPVLDGYSWISGYRVACLSSRAIAAAMSTTELPAEHRTFAAEDAGYFAYRTDWRLLDLLGLTTPEILTEDVGGAVQRLAPTVLILNAPNHSRPESVRLRSRRGGPDAAVPDTYRFVKHLPFTNAYWWPEVDYGYFIFVNQNASPELVRRLQSISVDVDREMGWQIHGFRILRWLTSLGL